MLRVRALGTAEIDAAEVRITPGSPRKFALLLRLAADSGRRIPRVVLRELIFPDLPEKNARHSLRDLIYQFRQAGLELDADPDGVSLPVPQVTTDYLDLINSAQPSIPQLLAAQNGLLPGYAPDHSEAFTEWLEVYRARLTLELCRTLSTIMIRARTAGDWNLTQHAAQACLGLDASHEEATLILAEALAVSGSKARAEELLDQYANDVGKTRQALQVPAHVLKRRITERIGERYRSGLVLPFSGREAEMLSLNDRFESARAGQAQCVIVAGEAGIGKSRLAEEFCTQAALRGARVEYVSTQPHDTHRPLATFADLVPKLLRIPGALGCSPESMTALRRLTTLDVGNRDAATEQNPEAIAASISHAIVDLIGAVATESVLFLFVDDVQWIDELSRNVLASLASAKKPLRLFVLLTSREKKELQFFSRRAERLLPITLKPLRAHDVANVLGRLSECPHLISDDELREWIAVSCGGNPLFLRSLISHYQATGERFVVPSTLSALLDQQLLSIGSDALAILSMCVALGRYSDLDHLVAALEVPQLQLQVAIRELEATSLLVGVGGRIEPAHWLIADAVNRAISPIAQKLLHRRVAQMLESEAADTRSASSYWDCAEHWILADEPLRAAVALEGCANHSVGMGRPREAAEVLLRAATLLDGGARADFLRRCVELADPANEPAVVLQAVHTAAHLNVTIGGLPDLELIEARARMLVLDESQFAKDTFRRWLDRSRPIASRLRAGTGLLTLAIVDCDPELADEAYRCLRDDLAQEDRASKINSLLFRMTYESRFGNRNSALELARDLLRVADDEPSVIAVDIRRKCAVVFHVAGEFEDAVATLQVAFTNASKHGLTRAQSLIANLLRSTTSAIGDDSASERWSSTHDSIIDVAVDIRMYADTAIDRAERACLNGDPGSARRWLDVLRDDFGATPTARISRVLRALEAWISRLEGLPVKTDALVASLTSHHRINREPADIGDMEVYAAMDLLVADNRAADARSLLSRYVTDFRRARCPLSRPLQEMALRVEWEGDPELTPATLTRRVHQRQVTEKPIEFAAMRP